LNCCESDDCGEDCPPANDEDDSCDDDDCQDESDDECEDEECEDEECEDEECEDDCRGVQLYPYPRKHRDCYTRSELAEIVSDTMPNIPECLINFIADRDVGFLDYIIKNHNNFVGLVLHMNPCTINRFCKDVPLFGIKLEPQLFTAQRPSIPHKRSRQQEEQLLK
uniref:Halomucin n=1 Tax=Rodentolepis nana TaxID=102285 RepID=A0A0R3TJ63_RODNA